MAVFKEWTSEQTTLWEEWVATRPKCIQDMCATHRPNVLYELKTTGQRVYLKSFNEDGTATVIVPPEYNPGRKHVGHGVFGIKLTDLIETDLPPGTGLQENN